MVYEDYRPVDDAKGYVCVQNISTKSGLKLTSKGMLIDDSVTAVLKRHHVGKVRVIRKIGCEYADEQSADEDLAASVNGVVTGILHGLGVSAEARDKLFDVLYFCSGESFIRLVKQLQTLEETDAYSFERSLAVAWAAVKLGRLIKKDRPNIRVLMQIGLLQDIGKTQIPASILSKTTKHTKAELDIVNSHPILGAWLLDGLVDEAVISGVLNHHEYLDGSGFPNGRQYGEVPRAARVIAIVDAFGSLIAKRKGKTALHPGEAVKVLRQMAFKGKIDFGLYDLFEEAVMHSFVGEAAPNDPESTIIGYDKGSLQLKTQKIKAGI